MNLLKIFKTKKNDHVHSVNVSLKKGHILISTTMESGKTYSVTSSLELQQGKIEHAVFLVDYIKKNPEVK